MNTSRARSGMTLIELVVGLTITGMVISSGYAAFAMVADRRESADRAASETARAVAVRRTMVAWLAGTRLTVEDDAVVFRGLDSRSGASDADELTFLTTAPTPLGDGGTTIRLHLDRDSTTLSTGLVAELGSFPVALRTATMELDTSVKSMSIRYVSAMAGNETWLPSWISASVLPRGIEVILGAAPGDTLHPLLSEPIVVPLGGR